MCHTDTIRPNIVRQLTKIMVAKFTGSHLNADMMKVGIFYRIEMRHMKRDIMFFTQLSAKLLIMVRLFTPKMEVAVDRLNLITQLPEHQEQSHTISPSRQGHEVFALSCQEVVFPDIISNSLHGMEG